MTKEQAIENAKRDMEFSKSDGYAIFKYPPYMVEKWKKLGYVIDYDYDIFLTYNDLKDFIQGKHTFNFVNADTQLRDGEKVVYAYSRTKIIIL